MRVSTSQMFNIATRNINLNRERFFQVQQILITQKKVNKPSDDPSGASRISGVKKLIKGLNQFQRNINNARSFVNTSEIALSQVIDDLRDVRDIAIDINGGNATDTDFQVAAIQISNKFQSILRNANMKDNNRYVFAGYRTTTPPFDDAGVYQGGVGEEIQVEITRNNFLTINQTGDEVFNDTVDVFQVLTDLEDAINLGDQALILNLGPQVEAALDQVIAKRSELGPPTVRLQNAERNNQELDEAYAEILGNIEDIDIAKATSEYAFQEQVYQATLMISARVFQQSLLDFIR